MSNLHSGKRLGENKEKIQGFCHWSNIRVGEDKKPKFPGAILFD